MSTSANARLTADAVIMDKLDEIESALDALRRLLEHRVRTDDQQIELTDLASRVRALRLDYAMRLKAAAEQVPAPETPPTSPSRVVISLSPNLVGLRRNLYEASHWAVGDWSAFRWHRSRSGEITADLPNSSQAFCVSTWGTAAGSRGQGVRTVIADHLKDDLVSNGLQDYAPSRDVFELEHVLAAEVLGEGGLGNPTNLDAVWRLPGLVVVVESKLTEGFGPCGQAKDGHCTGHLGAGSDLKTGTDVRCRLEVADGRREPRRYWQVLKDLAGSRDFPTEAAPCPLARGGYQVARVIAAAAEMGRRSGCDWRAVFAHPAMLMRDTRESLKSVTQLLSDENRRRVLEIDYSALVPDLLASGDDAAQGLGSHLWQRLAACRHHDAWSVLTGVPPAKPLRKGSKIQMPQYSISTERGISLHGTAYGSRCAHATGYLNPTTARLCFVVASRAGVRIRVDGLEQGIADELAEITARLAEELEVTEKPRMLRDAWTAMVSGPYPDVLDRAYAAVEARGYRMLWEHERATT